MRAEIGSQQLRTSFLASKQDSYEFYVDLLMRLHRQHPADGYDAAALQISERARARSLLEILSEAHVDIRQGVDATLLERERALSQTLHAKTDRLMRLLGQQNTQAPVAALQKEIGLLEAEFQEVQGNIRRNSPRYAAITQPRPLGFTELQQLLDQDTLLLEYSLGTDRSYLWAVSQNSMTSYELPGRGQIEKAARQVYNLVTSRSSRLKDETSQQRRERINKAETQLSEAARDLGAMVLGPVAAVLENKRLLIVADGALQYIPFSMLPVPEASHKVYGVKSRSPTGAQGEALSSDVYGPLIINHEIINLPSASSLAMLRRETAGRKMAPQNIAVMADPVFENTDERVKPATKVNKEQEQNRSVASDETRILEHLAENSTGQPNGAAGKIRIPRLPYTRLEADRILQVAPGATNLRVVDFKANREMATGGELHKYRYIHFATHGYIDSLRPELSAVVLSLVNERGEPQDGFLRTQEIYNLNLSAELVVLSSCQTGLGKEIKGEGLVGLTRGFMYAGAARVIVSLWNVSDRGTADLMWRLYQGMLREGLRPAAALRSAQLAMLRQRRWLSPYYWAAFIQQGEWK
jgi:CHAT domain-containing protein